MNGYSVAFVAVNGMALLMLPRGAAPLPLLVGAFYMTLGQVIEVGPLHFPVIRIMVALGMMRIVARGERIAGGMNALDWLMVVWAAWALTSSLFRSDIKGTLINHLGLVYNACGIYFLLRVFCQSLEDIVTLCRISAVVLVPLSVMILVEKITGHNPFSVLGGVAEISEIRDGRIRAQGPFTHSITAGTAGAVSLPLMICLWQRYRKTAIAGMVACITMIFASSSSGPIVSAMCAFGALLLWHWRLQIRLIRWLAVIGVVALGIVMKAPVYYLIARIDLTGSSTSWHRAALIESAIGHLSEWWLAGTDYTRHWMPYSALWSEQHADITNYYLRMGVDGGLPLMLLLVAILAKGFAFVGQGVRQADDRPLASRFVIWSLGASLLTHAATFMSVSYFDQSVVFFYLTLAAIGSIHSDTILENSGKACRGAVCAVM